MSEELKPEPQVAKETKWLVEKIGKDKVRAIAALGLAAAGLLGVSGKPESGIGVGIDIPNPVTGDSVSVGVIASSTETEWPLGLPTIPGKPYENVEAYQVRIGNAMTGIYIGSLKNKNGSTVKTIGIYPGFETRLGNKK